MQTKEEWKDIKGYEGYYQVSNLGNVKSLDRLIDNKKNTYIRQGNMIKQFYDNRGYMQVTICKNGLRKTYKTHRLVAEAFIENPYNLPEVNHKDENSLNNTYNNLEWCTAKYNCNYGSHNVRCAKSRYKKIYQYDLQDNLIREWNSVKETQTIGGFTASQVSNCCRGKIKTHKGYKWKFKSNN